MRLDLYRCEQCQTEQSAEYQLPQEWITTIQNSWRQYDEKEEKHFCCVNCLLAFFTKQQEANQHIQEILIDFDRNSKESG